MERLGRGGHMRRPSMSLNLRGLRQVGGAVCPMIWGIRLPTSLGYSRTWGGHLSMRSPALRSGPNNIKIHACYNK